MRKKCPKCKKTKNEWSFVRRDGSGYLEEEEICNKCYGVKDQEKGKIIEITI